MKWTHLLALTASMSACCAYAENIHSSGQGQVTGNQQAIFSNGFELESLFVPEGEEITLSGNLCYEHIRIEGTIRVASHNGDSKSGSLKLRSLNSITILPSASIIADAAGHAGGKRIDNFNLILGGASGIGAGPGCGGGPGASVGQGGTGGSYAGLGGTPTPNSFSGSCDTCSEPTIPHCIGAPSPAYGTATETDFQLGSGGGASGDSSDCPNSGSNGGNGGGAIALIANDTVTIDGRVSAEGQRPSANTATCGYRPGGGGGSGGTILIASPQITGSGQLSVSGGQGGEALGEANEEYKWYGTWGWAGGGGSGGRIKQFGNSSFNGNIAVEGGLGGLAPSDVDSSPGLPGESGTHVQQAIIPAEFQNTSCD